MTKYDNDGPNLEEEQMLVAEASRRNISVTQLRMLLAVPDSLVRDLVADVRRAPPRAKPVSTVGGRGWVEPRPLSPPPGVSILDKIMDQADALDRRELARRLGG